MTGRGQPDREQVTTARRPRVPVGRSPRVPLSWHQGVEAAVGLFLVLFPAPAAFYNGGLIDFSVVAVFVAGAVALPMVGLAFAATREGRVLPAGLHLTADRVLTAVLLVVTAAFTVQGDAPAVLLFGTATAVYAVLLLTTIYDASESDEAGGTTVSDEREHRPKPRTGTPGG